MNNCQFSANIFMRTLQNSCVTEWTAIKTFPRLKKPWYPSQQVSAQQNRIQLPSFARSSPLWPPKSSASQIRAHRCHLEPIPQHYSSHYALKQGHSLVPNYVSYNFAVSNFGFGHANSLQNHHMAILSEPHFFSTSFLWNSSCAVYAWICLHNGLLNYLCMVLLMNDVFCEVLSGATCWSWWF